MAVRLSRDLLRDGAAASASPKTRVWLRELPKLLETLERTCCAGWQCCKDLLVKASACTPNTCPTD